MWLFVIDTDAYSGNYERQLTAWCTGVVGECGIGTGYALVFRKEYPLWAAKFEQWVAWCHDEHGVERSCAIFPTPGWSNDGDGNHFHDTTHPYPAYQSIAISFTERPTEETIRFLMHRARTYEPSPSWDACGTITGFRLLEQTPQSQEYPVSEPELVL